ncbi:hypothetical protein [Intestinibacter bartlettii]|uniref:Uncharacterized protein n=1 Tax=Intestinibacter bartlettii TaxID=261299 RepID=A0ABS6E079_9FIRM|nr:hypothetical protein [Intestinibacter bartlettii]MBU5337508.1 hypothetical protein [Intestinibacter bartlettii]
MQEEKDRINIYQLIWNCLKWLLERVIHYAIVFIRMTIYYIVKLIYKIFRLREIDVERQRSVFEDMDDTVTYKHEFVFKKSEKFIDSWFYIQDLVHTLGLTDDQEKELYDFIIQLVAEAERGAFNTTYEYLRTKDLKEPSFQDLCIQGIFNTSSDIDPRDRFENPRRQQEGIRLHYKREKEKNDKVDEAKARGIF